MKKHEWVAGRYAIDARETDLLTQCEDCGVGIAVAAVSTDTAAVCLRCAAGRVHERRAGLPPRPRRPRPVRPGRARRREADPLVVPTLPTPVERLRG